MRKQSTWRKSSQNLSTMKFIAWNARRAVRSDFKKVLGDLKN